MASNNDGAFWKKVSQNGKEYWSGYLEDETGNKIRLTMFYNKYSQDDDRQPQFHILKVKPKDEDSNSKQNEDDQSSEDSKAIPF